MRTIISAILSILAPLIVFSAYDISIPDLGEGCVLDPKTGQCAVSQPAEPVYPVIPDTAADIFELDMPAPKPVSVPVKSPPPLPAESVLRGEVLIKEEISLPFFERQEIRDFFEKIGVPSSITIAAVSGGALLLTAAAGNVQVALNLTNIFQFLDSARLQLLGLVRFKKRKPWGRVMEKLNGRPISGAKVHLFSAEFNKLLDIYITDAEGRFEFLANSGVYFLKISKKGFVRSETDPIHIKSAEQVINKEIFLVPEIKSMGIGTIFRVNIFNLVLRFIDFLNPLLLMLGTLLSAGAVFSSPSWGNYFILGLYIFLDAIKIYLAILLVRPDGLVVDHAGNPVKNSVIRIFNSQKNLLVTTAVSDKNGKFNILLVSGKYYLTCSAAGYKPHRSDIPAFSKDNLPDLKIRLEK